VPPGSRLGCRRRIRPHRRDSRHRRSRDKGDLADLVLGEEAVFAGFGEAGDYVVTPVGEG
jgi:hypothetical protein